VKGIDNLDHEVVQPHERLAKSRPRHIRRNQPRPLTFGSSATEYTPIMFKAFSAIFISVFLAEIGDKTQLATMLFASEAQNNKWVVFAASATALVLASAIGVLVGAQLERFVKPSTLKLIAGAGFIVIGLWTMLSRG